MFQNLIKIALRVIRKDLFYSIFNIAGLTIGITSSLFLLLYILDELSYDRYHEQSENIYRVVSHISEPDDAFDWIVAQVPFAPTVKDDYPEVEEYVRFIDMGNTLFIKDDLRFYEDQVYYVDSTVFRVFTYNLVTGDPDVVLNAPNSIVVTRSFAHRYFGDENPVGQSIRTEDEESYIITGLMEDVPANSHFRFSALISRNTLPEQFGGGWGNFGVFTYLLLNEKTDSKQLEEKLSEMYDKYMADIFEQFNIKIVYGLDRISKIHLYSKYEGEPEPAGSIQYIYVFVVVILFMLIIASINYMNLATARSTKRAREVGLRKVSGSGRGLLIVQFLTESLALTIISLLFSILLIFLLLPQFNFISGKLLEASVLGHPAIVLSILLIIFLLGIIGGSYPAFYLSGFTPLAVLKGSVTTLYRKYSFRKVLVVIQFSISLVMIISTLVVYDQIGFLTKKDIGFEKSNVVRLTLSTDPMSRQFNILKDALLSSPSIINVGGTSSRVGEGSGKVIMNLETPDGMDERGVNIGVCDEDFIETMGITILEGRDFSSDIMADTATGVLINETLAKRMNWDEPIGKKVQLGSGNEDNDNPVARVVGLMKDYNQTGLYSEVESYLLLYRRNNRVVYVRISEEDRNMTLQFIEEKWNEIFPDVPFKYSFLEDDFKNQFEQDKKRGLILGVFSILTIIIASLGLFGLSSYTVEQRNKEIGIRKVLGAGVGSINTMIISEFTILIGIAIFIAFPIAIYLMNDWLQNFVYRTSLRPVTFLLTTILIFAIALLTISFHTIRAGRANPVDSIRQE